MPDVAHSTLTGSDLHEPKGIDGASVDTVYVANGAGSGTHQKIGADQIGSSVKNVNKVFITYTIDDISTAASHWVVPGIAGDIVAIKTVLHGAIGTADAGLTFEIGGTALTGSAITITQSGSAAGDVDSSTPSANNTVTATDPLEIITDGASTNTIKVTVTIEVDVS